MGGTRTHGEVVRHGWSTLVHGEVVRYGGSTLVHGEVVRHGGTPGTRRGSTAWGTALGTQVVRDGGTGLGTQVVREGGTSLGTYLLGTMVVVRYGVPPGYPGSSTGWGTTRVPP